MPSIEQITESLDAHIGALNAELASLEKARAALINGSSPTTPAPSAPKRTRRRTRRRKPRGKTVLLAGTVVKMLAESDGLTTSALANQADADPAQVLRLLKNLEGGRQVRRTGERRATRWHAITDEDRISERVAELAARSKRLG